MATAERATRWRSVLRGVRPDGSGQARGGREPESPEPAESSEQRPDTQVASPSSFDREVEAAVLRAPRRYTRGQVHRITGIDEERADRLWRAMGFPGAGEDDVLFTDSDLAAIGRLERLSSAGLVPAEVQEAVIRSMARAMTGLASWQAELLNEVAGDREDWSSELRDVLPVLEGLQNYVWRRHLAAAAGRLLTVGPDEADVRTLAVGSADLVEFSRTARRLRPSQLAEMVELFHRIVADVVADHRGRVVKTFGGAVQFVTYRPEDAAALALDLVDRMAEASGLPELRTGLAVGEALTRFGDVYGEVVDTAARLCRHTRPGRILVDQELATALEEDNRFQLRPRRPLTERGLPKLRPWGLRRSSDRTQADE
ncbi:MAG: adenylate/guanylate cyclase domain-containing protein [Pseudonocardia sp.]|nr:adenylate/guanylate cyclase domain-containing protein [Pseudonocardia sp.]MBO0872424.1 adenylate/guanylate cyclase domain-containing protein [Pseudonocardia sp.]